ncbi:cell division protein ZapC [Pseudoalteromonas sp. HM-SA03]|uniref:cell division protein ZapC domain-containing protein n=1 Tax=Pseudoalteromonas sp. HM-SA03 TaxID=2029678 RepID=UPI000BADEAFC|nr:cell division protein ZapC domain-containing protein [Pseudoalteromonas sp. HM-SA03]PAX99923.1 cell division protein ZapC [Pseudoalteromonas sp. HM-SA03]
MQASKEWQWIRCTERNRLLIDLGDELQLCTPFRLRNLTEDSTANPNFSLSEAEFYQSVFSYLCGFGVWNEPRCCQIALNATAAKFHLQPMQAKSWFFKPYFGGEPVSEAVVCLNSKVSHGEFLIIEHDGQSSLCLSLNEQFILDEGIELEQFQAIKVLNDRLAPLVLTHRVHQSA